MSPRTGRRGTNIAPGAKGFVTPTARSDADRALAFAMFVDHAGPAVAHMDSQCWLWTGYVVGGRYGRFHWLGGHMSAHRAAYEMSVGELRPGSVVRHRCDVMLCVNPAHLVQGSSKDNVGDRHSRGRDAHGPGHGRSKMTAAGVLEARVAYDAGEPINSIARRYGLSDTAMGLIVKRRHWRSV